MKSGNLNFLEPSGPLQACNGTALPLPISIYRYLCLFYVAGSGAKLERRNFVHNILKHEFNGGIEKYTVS
jgi:hypothetical protein